MLAPDARRRVIGIHEQQPTRAGVWVERRRGYATGVVRSTGGGISCPDEGHDHCRSRSWRSPRPHGDRTAGGRSIGSARLREPHQQHLRQAPRLRDARGRPRAPAGAPEHRRPQNGGTRAAGTEGTTRQRRVRRRPCSRTPGYDVDAQTRSTSSSTRAGAGAAHAGQATYETGAFTGSAARRRHGQRDSRRHQPRRRPRSRATQRLRSGRLRDGVWTSRSRTDIALIQRGTLQLRAQGRERPGRGREAVIIFNQGNTPSAATADGHDRRDDSARPSTPITVPVVGASFADGEALAAAGLDRHVPRRVDDRTMNVIAELPGKNADNVVMAGAHLDSRARGPGDQRQRLRLGRAARDRAA